MKLISFCFVILPGRAVYSVAHYDALVCKWKIVYCLN